MTWIRAGFQTCTVPNRTRANRHSPGPFAQRHPQHAVHQGDVLLDPLVQS
ncbi:hypothetical protein AB0J42_37105 [Nonomuraea sp. NPDC049649]